MNAPTPSAAAVLRHTTAFLDELLSNPDLRHRTISATRRSLLFPYSSPAALEALAILSHALDFPSSAATPIRPSPSALRAAEKLLLSLPRSTSLSSLLLAIAAAARCSSSPSSSAAVALLDVFALDPALARHEIAPEVFEDLFVPHLIPLIQRFADERTRILSSSAAGVAENDEEGRSVEVSAAAMSVLSRMSGGQAEELKALERWYETALDENSRAYAEYLKDVVELGDGVFEVPASPELILTRMDGEGKGVKEAVVGEEEDEEEERTKEIGLRNGRYNPTWTGEDETVKVYSRQNSKSDRNLSRMPTLYPQRVPPHLLVRQPLKDDQNSLASLLPDSGPTISSDDMSENSSLEMDADMEEKKNKTELLQPQTIQSQRSGQMFAESARELRKSSVLAHDMLKLLLDGQESSIDMRSHKELIQVDCSRNGEVLSIIDFKNLIFSGQSDGTIKDWEGSENLLNLIHEAREHSKAVTSLALLQDKLYSGSLDKSIRVWSLRDGGLHCIEIHDVKDPVHNLTVATTIACFIPQGAGIKVVSWNGGPKLLNSNKYVKSLALAQGKIYCGCHDSSIQEIDLATGTLGTIQSGNRKLLGKTNPIYAVQVHDKLLYSASTSLDGAALKIWDVSNYNLVGSIPSSTEVRSMVISTELIYLGCKTGVVEIWSKEKHSRVGALQTGTNSRIMIYDLCYPGLGIDMKYYKRIKGIEAIYRYSFM